MKNKTISNSATASSDKDKKSTKKKEANPNADTPPAKRAGSVEEIDEADVQDFKKRKKASTHTDAAEEDLMTAIENTRAAANGYVM